MNEEILKFIIWFTGHDEQSIIQVYNDYCKSPNNKSIPMDAEVKVQTANKIYTEYLDVIDIRPELIENLEKRIWLHIKDNQYIFMGNWSMPIAQRGKYLFNIKDKSFPVDKPVKPEIANDWISVKDRLPDNEETIIVYIPEMDRPEHRPIQFARYVKSIDRFFIEGTPTGWFINYWQPLMNKPE